MHGFFSSDEDTVYCHQSFFGVCASRIVCVGEGMCRQHTWLCEKQTTRHTRVEREREEGEGEHVDASQAGM